MKVSRDSEHRSATTVYTGWRATSCLMCGETDPDKFRKNERRKRCKACWKKLRRADPNWREKQQDKDRQPRNRFSNAKSQAKQRGKAWTLTFEQWQELVSQPCHYCSGPLGEFGRGLDRKRNEQDYTAENCVPCCALCNQTKAGTFTYEEMLEVGALIRKFRERRTANGEPELVTWISWAKGKGFGDDR